MKIYKINPLLLIFISLIFPNIAHSNPKTPRLFVEEFYNWYVPLTQNNHESPSWRIALGERAKDFSPLLIKLFEKSFSAQDKCEDLVGLDFDPFLDSQDPSPSYGIGNVKKNRSGYLIEIYNTLDEKKYEKRKIIISLHNTNGNWIFSNFFYKDKENLLKILTYSDYRCSTPRKPLK
jgi:hypothetical protein